MDTNPMEEVTLENVWEDDSSNSPQQHEEVVETSVQETVSLQNEKTSDSDAESDHSTAIPETKYASSQHSHTSNDDHVDSPEHAEHSEPTDPTQSVSEIVQESPEHSEPMNSSQSVSETVQESPENSEPMDPSQSVSETVPEHSENSEPLDPSQSVSETVPEHSENSEPMDPSQSVSEAVQESPDLSEHSRNQDEEAQDHSDEESESLNKQVSDINLNASSDDKDATVDIADDLPELEPEDNSVTLPSGNEFPSLELDSDTTPNQLDAEEEPEIVDPIADLNQDDSEVTRAIHNMTEPDRAHSTPNTGSYDPEDFTQSSADDGSNDLNSGNNYPGEAEQNTEDLSMGSANAEVDSAMVDGDHDDNDIDIDDNYISRSTSPKTDEAILESDDLATLQLRAVELQQQLRRDLDEVKATKSSCTKLRLENKSLQEYIESLMARR